MNTIRLTLQGYRRFHASSVFTILPGLTVISGENGAGKSTLGQAILHALFAATPKPDPRSDASETPYQLRLEMTGGETNLEVTAEGGRYQVQIDGRPHVFGRNGTPRAAQAAISAYLGLIGQDAFEKVYFALQNDTAAFVGMKPKQRRELIEEVLQLKTVDLAVDLQKVHVKELRDAMTVRLSATAELASVLGQPGQYQEWIKEFQKAVSARSKSNALAKFSAEFTGLLEHHQAVVAQQITGFGVCQTALKAAGEAVESKAVERQDADQTCRRFAKVRGEQETALRELAEAQAVVKTLLQNVGTRQQAVEAAQAAEPQAQQYDAEVAQQAQGQERLDQHLRYKTLSSQWETAHRTRLGFESRLRHLTALDQDVQDHLAEQARRRAEAETYAADPYTEQLAVNRGVRDQLKKEADELRQSLAQLTAGDADVPCPTCGAPMTVTQIRQRQSALEGQLRHVEAEKMRAMDGLVASLEAQQKSWKQGRGAALQALEAADAVCAGDRESLATRTEIEAQLNEARQTEAAALQVCESSGLTPPLDRSEEGHLRAAILACQTTVKRLEQPRALFMQLEERCQLHQVETERLASAQSVSATCREKWEKIIYDGVAHQTAEKALEDTGNALSAAQVAEEAARGAARSAETTLKSAKAHLEKLTARRDDIQSATAQLSRQERLVEHLSGFQGHFFSVNVKEVMRRASQLIAPATANAIRALELDAGADLYYWDQFKQRYDARRLSGGEQALVGLCIRLALAERAQAIISESRVKFLILDEVLGSLDDGRRKAVQGILGNVLQQGAFEHIVMITHLDEVKNNWEAHRLEVRLDSSSGMSSVTVLDSTWPS